MSKPSRDIYLPPGNVIAATSITLHKRTKFDEFSKYLCAVLEQVKAWREHGSLLYYDFDGMNPDYFTLSIWSDNRAMREFGQSEAHQRAVAQAPNLGIVAVKYWTANKVPEWKEVKQKFSED
jgi:quinol monooxygenase YgiN